MKGINIAGANAISPLRLLFITQWKAIIRVVTKKKAMREIGRSNISPCKTSNTVKSFRSPMPTFDVSPIIQSKKRARKVTCKPRWFIGLISTIINKRSEVFGIR